MTNRNNLRIGDRVMTKQDYPFPMVMGFIVAWDAEYAVIVTMRDEFECILAEYLVIDTVSM
jgi:MinD superfamily P-loop ATPase